MRDLPAHSRRPRRPPTSRRARQGSATRSSRNAGNGGYDVANYDLTLAYDPATTCSTARPSITATATQDLSRFDLDLRGFQISKLTVNGGAASYRARRPGARDHAARPGSAAARPSESPSTTAASRRSITDPDQSIEGWMPTDDGAFVVGEPQGSPGWYPCNDNPRDKATFDFAVTVPAGPDRDGERRARLVGDERRQDDLGLAGDRPDGDRTSRRRRSAGSISPCRRRRADCPSTSRSTHSSRRGRCSRSCRRSVDFYASHLRAVPVQRRRGDRRLGEGRRLLARDADEAELPVRAGRGDARARDLAHVVRRLGDADAVAGHLAARGLRHLVRVDLERVPGQQDRPPSGSSSSTTRRRRTRRSGTRRRRTRARRRSSSTARSTTAAG